MELIYSTQISGFDPEKRYRNPEHFDRPESGVTSVLVVGAWPGVVNAYEQAHVEVSVVDVPKGRACDVVGGASDGGRDEEFHAEINGVREDLKLTDLIVESFAERGLERPEGEMGPVSGRLFQVLEAVNAGVQILRNERDAEADKARTLQKQVDDLLDQAAKSRLETEDAKEAKDIAELKAALDAAKIPYRANASKDALEKLVADLAKA